MVPLEVNTPPTAYFTASAGQSISADPHTRLANYHPARKSDLTLSSPYFTVQNRTVLWQWAWLTLQNKCVAELSDAFRFAHRAH